MDHHEGESQRADLIYANADRYWQAMTRVQRLSRIEMLNPNRDKNLHDLPGEP